MLQETLQSLERAFRIDPYPERPDKVRLAQETGMEYKQVNVWVCRVVLSR